LDHGPIAVAALNLDKALRIEVRGGSHDADLSQYFAKQGWIPPDKASRAGVDR